MANKRRVGIWLFAGIVIAGIIALSWWRLGSGDGQNPSAPTLVTDSSMRLVQTQVVGQRDLRITLSAHGTIQASREVAVPARISAPVHEVAAGVGDIVEAGSVLLTLDRSELEIQLLQARANLLAAESQLARIEAGARPQELAQAEAQVRQAQANVNQAHEELQRIRSLHQSGAATLSQLNQVETQAEVAEAQLAALESQLSLVTVGSRPEERMAAQAQVEQARAGVSLAELYLSYSAVTAPISGVIVSRSVELGEFAQAGVPLFRILQVDPVAVKTQVGARDFVRIAPGATAHVYVDAFPGENFQGTISRIDAAADPMTRLFGVEVSIDNPDGRLRPGMSARIEITLAESLGATVVPQSSVVRTADEAFVFVTDGKTVSRRPVETGIAAGEWVEALRGVSPGERVVSVGAGELEDGEPVLAERGVF